MDVTDTALPGVRIIEPDVYGDDRGFFLETWNAERYRAHGIDVSFVQDNLSKSQKGVLRGLHFQNPAPQAKLVSVVTGSVYDVVVDVRWGSDTFGEWIGMTLSGDTRRQVFIPEGYAHGFVVLSDAALFHYKCSDVYTPSAEQGIRWDDPDLAIDWPVDAPILSEKDAAAPLLTDLDTDVLTFPAPLSMTDAPSASNGS